MDNEKPEENVDKVDEEEKGDENENSALAVVDEPQRVEAVSEAPQRNPSPPQQHIPSPQQQRIPSPPQQRIPSPPQQRIPSPPQQRIPSPPSPVPQEQQQPPMVAVVPNLEGMSSLHSLVCLSYYL
jgi:hypothetical protein